MRCQEKGCNRESTCRGSCHKHYKRMRRRELRKGERFITDPNEFIDCGDYWEIKLYDKNGNHTASAKIDAEDVEKCRKFKWSRHNAGYVAAKAGRILLHRLVLGILNTRKEGDHIKGDRLDNRKEFLRVCSHAQNAMNTGRRKNNKSGLKGVYPLRSGRWSASIWVQGKGKWLGSFPSKEEAARSYNKAASEFFGEFAFNR